MDKDNLLTPESREAIRSYIFKLFAIPSVILMVLSFFVGFFIKDVAQTKANLEASNKVSEITQSALVKVHNLTEQIYKDQANFAQKLADKRVEASNTLESISKLSKEVTGLKTSVNLVKKVKVANNLSEDIAKILIADKDFQKKISETAVSELKPMIEEQSPKVHFKEWKFDKKETGEATEWSPLPTDLAINVETNNSRLVIMSDISRVQHQSPDINTEYRITVNGEEISRTNTGGHHTFEFSALSLLGSTQVSRGHHNIRVEYKTMDGVEYWGNSVRGLQQRRIIVLEIPNVEL